MAVLNEIPKLSDNTVKNTDKVKITSSNQNKDIAEKPTTTSNDIDKIEISKETQKFYDKINEAQNYLDDLKEINTIDEEETKEISNKVASGDYLSEHVTGKIVHSLLTLPAFNELITQEKEESVSQQIHHKELEKIYTEIQRGNNNIETLYDDVINYIMKSLL